MPINFEETFPLTFEQAVQTMIDGADYDEVEHIKEHGVVHLHHSLGMAMRNGWHLWQDDFPLTRHMQERFGLLHADDNSSLILEAVECHFKGVEFHPEMKAEYYHNFWLNQGIDPKTMKEIK